MKKDYYGHDEPETKDEAFSLLCAKTHICTPNIVFLKFLDELVSDKVAIRISSAIGSSIDNADYAYVTNDEKGQKIIEGYRKIV